jgi:hypothetical protein
VGNRVGVEAKSPHLFQGPGVVVGIHGVREQEFGLPLRSVELKGDGYRRPQKNPLGCLLGDNLGSLWVVKTPSALRLLGFHWVRWSGH